MASSAKAFTVKLLDAVVQSKGGGTSTLYFLAEELIAARDADLTRLARAQGIREALDSVDKCEAHSEHFEGPYYINKESSIKNILALLDRDAEEALAEHDRQVVADAIEQCAVEAGERSPEGVSSHTMLGDMWDRRILELRSAAREGQAEASPEGRDGK